MGGKSSLQLPRSFDFGCAAFIQSFYYSQCNLSSTRRSLLIRKAQAYDSRCREGTMRARGRRRAGSRALGCRPSSETRGTALSLHMPMIISQDHTTMWSRGHVVTYTIWRSLSGFQEKCNGESLSGPHSELERYSMCHIGPRFFFPFMFRLRCFAYITGATRRARASLLLSVEFFQLGNARCTLAMHHCECFHETSQPLTAFSLGAPRSDIFLPPETGLRNVRVSHVRRVPWQNFFPVH